MYNGPIVQPEPEEIIVSGKEFNPYSNWTICLIEFI